jgi:undecaprenyl-diphosphatase
MNGWQVMILGIVEGISEFLPISSTGHLILVSKLIGVIQTDFAKSFEIAIQLGAILAVVVLYWKRLLVNKEVFKRVVIAFIPTGILGFALYKMVKHYLLGNVNVTLVSLLLGGVLMIGWDRVFKWERKLTIEKLSMSKLLLIGIIQAISIVPGVSRAMATILAGLGVGLMRSEAVEMSFLLAVPTMAAATGLDLLKSGASFTTSEWMSLMVGFGVAFGSALVTVKWLIGYVKKHNFENFGWYRVLLAVVFGLLVRG